MRKIIFGLVLALSSAASAAPYFLDQQHLSVGFSVKHLMISNVKGSFSKVSGGFDYDSTKKILKDVNVEVDMSSVDTNEPDRDKHLKSPDFFDVAKYPKMTFKSEKVEFSADGKSGKMSGVLTLHGKSKTITLDFVNAGEVEFMGTKKVAFSAKGIVNRKDFAMTWNKNLDKGGVAVGEEVMIEIEGEANLAAAKKK